MDDARLFLLEGSCSSEEKARTLASVGLISPESGGYIHRGALLLMYLQGADVLLESAIEGLGERIAEHHTGDVTPLNALRCMKCAMPCHVLYRPVQLFIYGD